MAAWRTADIAQHSPCTKSALDKAHGMLYQPGWEYASTPEPAASRTVSHGAPLPRASTPYIRLPYRGKQFPGGVPGLREIDSKIRCV